MSTAKSGETLCTARGGDDLLAGGQGNDLLAGGDGDDILVGDEGDDTIYGEVGNDVIYGNTGRDIVEAGPGSDLVFGGDGDDLVIAQEGNDLLWGEDGDDSLYGEAGRDALYGGAGRDLLAAGADNDSIEGGHGDDRLFGEAGDDSLVGGGDDDLLHGGDGDDIAGYSAPRSSYMITIGAGFVTVSGPDGTDILFDMERIRFGDGQEMDLATFTEASSEGQVRDDDAIICPVLGDGAKPLQPHTLPGLDPLDDPRALLPGVGPKAADDGPVICDTIEVAPLTPIAFVMDSDSQLSGRPLHRFYQQPSAHDWVG